MSTQSCPRTNAIAAMAVICVVLASTGLGGCAWEPLRDEYLGKSVVQPAKVSQPMRRDAYGNPILDGTEDATWSGSGWPSIW